jgi:hypothetical protein
MLYRIVLVVLVALLAFPPSAEAQSNCDGCVNHWFYAEHQHGNIDYGHLYTNDQNHGGGWYAYWCGVDHEYCGPAEPQLAEAAANVKALLGSGDYEVGKVRSVLRMLNRDGISATVTAAGLELTTDCDGSNARSRTAITVAVPLPTALRARALAALPRSG